MVSSRDLEAIHRTTLDMLTREIAGSTRLIVLGAGAAPPPLTPEEKRRRELAARAATVAFISAESGIGTQAAYGDDWRRRQDLQNREVEARAAELPTHMRRVVFPGSESK